MDLTCTNGTVAGYLYGLNASSVEGSRVKANTSTYNATLSSNNQALTWGTTNITATSSNGTIGVYIKTGCGGTATNATGSITGSPVTFTSGWNSLNVTGNGTISLFVYMPYSVIGTIDGVSGTGSNSYFLLAGTSIVTGLDEGNAVLTGVTAEDRIVAPGRSYTVTGNGTITIDMEPGNYGSASGSNLTVAGEASVDLVVGANSLALVTTGTNPTLTVEVTTYVAYQFNGKYKNPWFGPDYLSGIVAGFIVTDTDPWDADLFYDAKLKANKLTYDPILD